jgi:DNA-binding PadR family transcriptional regulator
VASRQPLTPTAYAILGLLAFGRELTGYEVKQWADDSLRFFYTAPAMSQIYTELERLHDAGLVLDRTVQDGNRTVRSYRLSARGAAALRTWAATTDPEPPVLKHHLALRVFLGHLVPPQRLIDQIRAHRAWLEQRRAELAAVQDDLAGDADGTWHYAELVARWGGRYLDGEIAAMDELLAELADPPPFHASSSPPPFHASSSTCGVDKQA